MALEPKDLTGTWTLDELYYEDDGGARNHPLGEDASGLLIYSPDGHMCAIVHAAGRSLPDAEPSAEARAAAFSNYFNYAGAWSLDGDVVTHAVAHALDPNMVGASFTRTVERRGARLVLSGLGPGELTYVIIWKRPG